MVSGDLCPATIEIGIWLRPNVAPMLARALHQVFGKIPVPVLVEGSTNGTR